MRGGRPFHLRWSGVRRLLGWLVDGGGGGGCGTPARGDDGDISSFIRSSSSSSISSHLVRATSALLSRLLLLCVRFHGARHTRVLTLLPAACWHHHHSHTSTASACRPAVTLTTSSRALRFCQSPPRVRAPLRVSRVTRQLAVLLVRLRRDTRGCERYSYIQDTSRLQSSVGGRVALKQ